MMSWKLEVGSWKLRKRRLFLFLFITPIFQLPTSNFLLALPPFKSIFESKYGYKVNCTLCHVESDWDLNRYGENFLKEGMSVKALEAIELVDTDGDGFLENNILGECQ
jgi:hypothetical protein